MPITPTNPFKGRQYAGEVILLAVRWYLRYPLAYLHISEICRSSARRLWRLRLCRTTGGISRCTSVPGSRRSEGVGGGYYEGPYHQLTQADDRFFFAGDHCSRVGAWQEGAALAAHRVVTMLSERVRASRLTDLRRKLA
jgi:hypothetical protein